MRASSILNPTTECQTKKSCLTGMPRHDRLWSMPKTATTLLVMPTWRKYLLDKKQKPIASFAESEYVRHWRSVLQSPALRRLVEEYGLDACFLSACGSRNFC